jgi:hypothetical protein
MKRRTLTIIAAGIAIIALIWIVVGLTNRSARMSLVAANDAYTRQYGLGGGGPAIQAPAMPLPAATMAAPYDAAKGVMEQPASPVNSAPIATQRIVIQNADLSIVVKDVNARAQQIQDMAKGMGGFVVSVNSYQTYASNGTKVPQAQVVVRVPQEKLDEALTEIKKDAVEVQNETRSGQDVTDQYVDLQSRLTAKEAAEAQLLKIMQDATRTEDVLAVYTQLQQIQSDIEVLKGQIKYIEQSAALSAISVNVIAEETIQPIKVGPWTPAGTARDAIQNLINFWKGFVEWMINFFLFTLPALITIAIPLFLVYLLGRWIYRKVRKPTPEVAPKEKTKK